MKNHIALLFLLALAFSKNAHGQLPNTNILLFETEKNGDGLRLSQPQFLTAWNRTGYNNQPNWLNTNELLITVGQSSDTTQTEIWQLNLATRTRSRVTSTREAEYSPTLMPDGKRFSSVLIEADGRATQRLWAYPLDRSAAAQLVFPNIKSVGYHCWLRDTLAALFIVEEPLNRLVVAGLRGQKPTLVATNPGRAMAKMNDGRLVFIQKSTEQTWYIKTWDPKKGSFEIIGVAKIGSEDFCLMADGSILMGDGPKLYVARPGKTIGWTLVGDLTKYGVKKITRLAASKEGRVAIVVQ